jgi:hypothetical protein
MRFSQHFQENGSRFESKRSTFYRVRLVTHADIGLTTAFGQFIVVPLAHRKRQFRIVISASRVL